MSSGAALSPRRATYFSLLRQRNLGKRKATLVPASLRCAALRATCGARPSRGLVQTRLRLKQARALIRLALCSSAHSQGFWGRARDWTRDQTLHVVAINIIAAHARFTWATALKCLKNDLPAVQPRLLRLLRPSRLGRSCRLRQSRTGDLPPDFPQLHL